MVHLIVKWIDVPGLTDFCLSNDLYLIFWYFFDYFNILRV